MQMGSDWDVSYSPNDGHKHTRFSNGFYDDDNYNNNNNNYNTQADQLLSFFDSTRADGKLKGRVTFSNGAPTPSPFPSSPVPPSSSSSPLGNGGAAGVGVGFLEHRVSKHDTLAGVAIKYGVEVADIKKMNGLVTDLQMFALKTLQIPLPGRHPPSPLISNGSDTLRHSNNEQTPPHHVPSDLFGSFQSLRPKSSRRKVSPAMDCLQGYYGLKQPDPKIVSESFEMSVYREGSSHHLEDSQYLTPEPAASRPLSSHRKSRSLVNGFLDVINGEASEGESERGNETLCRRRQKSVADFTSNSSEMLMREENSSGAFAGITGKGLALRPKAASKTALATEGEPSGLGPIPIGLGDSLVVDGYSMVRKSSSTPSFQDQDSSNSSIWTSSKWNLKPDLQAALSAAAITRPIFDGLPRPMTGRRNKAALD